MKHIRIYLFSDKKQESQVGIIDLQNEGWNKTTHRQALDFADSLETVTSYVVVKEK